MVVMLMVTVTSAQVVGEAVPEAVVQPQVVGEAVPEAVVQPLVVVEPLVAVPVDPNVGSAVEGQYVYCTFLFISYAMIYSREHTY